MDISYCKWYNIFRRNNGMDEILKEILSQMQVMSNEIKDFRDETNSRLAKLETTIENTTNMKIQALFEDREIVHSKLDTITNEFAEIKEQITDQDIKIQIINNKTKAI